VYKALLIIFLCFSVAAQAQTISVIPPNTGGFEVQLSSASQLATYEQYDRGEIVVGSRQVRQHALDLNAQLRIKERWVLAAKVPALHSVSTLDSANGLNKRHRPSNTQFGARFLVLKPGLIDKRRFLSATAHLVLPVRIPVKNSAGLATGFPSYALELGLLTGVEKQKMSIEGGCAYGHRIADYRSYVSAFGKFSLTAFHPFIPALTLQYMRALETGTYITPMKQIESGLYPDDQAKLAAHLEVKYPFSRFYGLTGSIGKVLAGHHVPNGTWLGLGLWFAWD
jgi:hypothetical protein